MYTACIQVYTYVMYTVIVCILVYWYTCKVSRKHGPKSCHMSQKERAKTPHEQLESHNVVNVVVAAVCPNAATTLAMIGECQVEIILDSG